MTSATKKVIQKTLKHYDEMIEWAKGQKAREYASADKMYDEIGQEWHGEFCPLCQKFYIYDLQDVGSPPTSRCGKCPLYAKYGQCGTWLGKTAWKNMDNSGTWKTWICHATSMREQIASLLEER
ncbi:MAG: hypothetical protein ABFD82_17995 [Syntrophaceae bacterium]